MFSPPALDHALPECSQADYARSYIAISGLGNINQVECGWDLVIRKLSSLHYLEDDWDGCGSTAPHNHVIQTAVKLAKMLRGKLSELPDRATATPAGTILFEWHGETKYHEYEVFAPDDVTLNARDNHGQYHHFKVPMPPFDLVSMPSSFGCLPVSTA